jgi:Holliday junction resolvasome RuvABC endonuclease subunit
MKMRELSDEDWTMRYVGIDNGTNTVGYVTLDGDLRTGVGTVSRAECLVAEKTAYDRYEGLANNRGQPAARMRVIKDFTYEYIDDEDPDEVGAESPFSHLHAHSFASLTTSMNVLDDAVWRYRPALPFEKVPPGRAKRAVCPEGQYSNKKEDIRKFILANPNIVAGEGIDLESLSEHEIDAIAVAWYLFMRTLTVMRMSVAANNMSAKKRSRK